MRAEIISVGTELLLGQISNTNARFISERLAGAGIDVLFHTTVGDNEKRIAETLALALSRNDAVVMTGGLGPTHDDLTRQAIAAATRRELRLQPELESELRIWFEERDRKMAEINLAQAYLPEGAVAIPNDYGTAPGIELEHDGKWIFAVPGVPREMAPMVSEHIAPRLHRLGGGEVLVSRTLKLTGIPEADVAEKIQGTIQALEGPDEATIALLASAGEVHIRISAKGRSSHAAFVKIFQVDSRLKRILGNLVFGAEDDTLESIVGDMARERNLTLGIAESFTAGALASRLISAPDASEYVMGGYVTYSPEAKMKDLGVPEDTLRKHGAVSVETALAMAEGVRSRTGADVGIATTGEAGPEPQEQPVGTMFIGLAWEGGSMSEHFFAPGERDSVTRFGTQAAINLFRHWMLNQPPGGP